MTVELKKFNLNIVKKWWWLPVVLFLVPTLVRADGMVIPKPTRVISETGQKAVIWHESGTETMILSTTFKGDADEFAWIIPVPSRPDVTKARDELFTALDDYTKPKNEQVPMPMSGITGVNITQFDYSEKVRVVETKKVDIYDVAVLEASDARALEKWLEGNGYDYPTNRSLLLKHYVDKGWYFVAVKVSADALGYVGSALSTGHATPLSITFASEQIVYPLKISGPGSKYIETEKLAAFSFESGQQSWDGGVVTSTQARDGKRSLRLTTPTYVQPTRPPTAGEITRPMVAYDRSAGRSISGIKKGIQYVYSAYLYSESKSGKVMLKAGIGTMQEASEEVNLSSLSKWTKVTLPFMPFDDGSVYLSVVIPQGEYGQEVYIDNVQLEIGEEPSEFTREIEPNTLTSQANQSISLVMYVFSDHKKYSPGFITEYAGNVPTKDIKMLAVDDDGNPWRQPKKAMYLTKLTRNMSQSEMTDDLVVRDAPDNLAVGGVNDGWGGNWRPMLVFALLGGLELFALGYYWYSKNRRKTV